MKSKTYNGEVRRGEKDFETLQLGAFATPGLLLAQGPVGLTAESGLSLGWEFFRKTIARRPTTELTDTPRARHIVRSDPSLASLARSSSSLQN
jgi:hypothetical protein